MGRVRTIVILAPMQVELSPVVRALALRRDDRGARRYSGTVGDCRVVALMAGVGPAAAARSTETAIAEHRPDHLIVAGIAGGIDPILAIGDLVVAEEATDHRSGRSTRPTPIGDEAMSGRIITTDTILADAQLAAEMAAGFVAVDMETAAVGAVCDDASVPWTAYRAISDRVGEGVIDESTLRLLNPDGSTNLTAVATTLLASPRVLPRFARMRRDGRRATLTAAAATAKAVERLALR